MERELPEDFGLMARKLEELNHQIKELDREKRDVEDYLNKCLGDEMTKVLVIHDGMEVERKVFDNDGVQTSKLYVYQVAEKGEPMDFENREGYPAWVNVGLDILQGEE
jgi:hypothetical protein